ncbi:hypothetical protein [Streptomyces sp. NPDC127112]|uniref:hypothetical protein n=1 Tax=Streptomyces sp. NPDC127112 TaxID=3345364 RepID=UPI003643289C
MQRFITTLITTTLGLSIALGTAATASAAMPRVLPAICEIGGGTPTGEDDTCHGGVFDGQPIDWQA